MKITYHSISCQHLMVESETLKDAIQVINQSASKICLVTDKSGKCVGTITDGDTRRAICNGCPLDIPATEVMNKHFSYVSLGSTDNEIIDIMRSKNILYLPLLSEDLKPIGINVVSEILEQTKRDNTVVIMAGGKGTRLRPLTNSCPKPMLLIGKKPILQIILEHFRHKGLFKFVISVNYLKDVIIDYFGDGSKFNIEIEYIVEDIPLGTAGSLSLLKANKYISDDFFLINGDVLTDVDIYSFLDLHYERGSLITVATRQQQYYIPYGVTNLKDGYINSIEEKPIYNYHISAGMYLINKKVLSMVDNSKYLDMPVLLNKLLDSNEKIAAFPIHEYWNDVGMPLNYEQAKNYYE